MAMKWSAINAVFFVIIVYFHALRVAGYLCRALLEYNWAYL